MVHKAESINQIRKYFHNLGNDLTNEQARELYNRGRDDFSLSNCDTLKEFREAEKT